MSDYIVEIEGSYNLDEINNQIAGEEAGASQFKSSQVSNNINNNVTFVELSAGTVPKSLKVVKKGGQQPAGTQNVWSGYMVVTGTSMEVTAYRTL